MLYELMSSGEAVRLPDEYLPGIDDCSDSSVMLLLPYNRYIIGHIHNTIDEKWQIGKLGTKEREEVFLYDDSALSLYLDNHRVNISLDVVKLLRHSLLSNAIPPGDHSPTVIMLRGLVKDVDDRDIFPDFLDEGFAFDEIKKSDSLASAYWGIRFAIARGDFDAVNRIKLWYRISAELSKYPNSTKTWFSLTPMPDKHAVEEMKQAGFSADNIERVAAQNISPVLLFSGSAYLLMALYGDGKDSPQFREWAFFSPPIWTELREKKRIPLRELMMAVWGAEDANEALALSKNFNLTRQ